MTNVNRQYEHFIKSVNDKGNDYFYDILNPYTFLFRKKIADAMTTYYGVDDLEHSEKIRQSSIDLQIIYITNQSYEKFKKDYGFLLNGHNSIFRSKTFIYFLLGCAYNYDFYRKTIINTDLNKTVGEFIVALTHEMVTQVMRDIFECDSKKFPMLNTGFLRAEYITSAFAEMSAADNNLLNAETKSYTLPQYGDTRELAQMEKAFINYDTIAISNMVKEVLGIKSEEKADDYLYGVDEVATVFDNDKAIRNYIKRAGGSPQHTG